MVNIDKQLNIFRETVFCEDKGKKVEVRNLLQQGFDLLLSSENNLPEEYRIPLSEILRWDGNPSKAEKIRLLVANLGKSSIESSHKYRWWTTWGIDKWFDLTYDLHLLSMIATYTQLGMPIEAFRAARIYLHRNPVDEIAINKAVDAIENLLLHLKASGERLLLRAQSTLEKGGFEAALQYINSLEDDLLGPFEQEFPDFLAGYEQIEALRIEAEHLKCKIHTLSTLRTEVYQPLDQIRHALLSLVKPLQDSIDILQTIPDLTSIPYLAQQIQDLWAQVLKE